MPGYVRGPRAILDQLLADDCRQVLLEVDQYLATYHSIHCLNDDDLAGHFFRVKIDVRLSEREEDMVVRSLEASGWVNVAISLNTVCFYFPRNIKG